MNLSFIDWVIVCSMLTIITFVAVGAKRYTKSVSDYLAANRSAGRYLLATAEGVAAMGAISFIGIWEMYYEAGFSAEWWTFMTIPAGMIITVTGYVIYRYRETKAMTIAQFFEMRYSRRFRIFAGLLCFISGVLNFGIFPGVGARFFIYFAGLPETFTMLGLSVSTFPVVMAGLLIISLLFVCLGGQISVILTDFFQGLFSNITFLIILVILFFMIDWSQISGSMLSVPEGQSRIDPFDGGDIKNFNMWYFVIATFGAFYGFMSWQGSQGYNCSAKSPHEAKMARIVGTWRYHAQSLMMLTLPIVAYAVMHHVDFSRFAVSATETLSGIDSATVREQMTVPVILSKFLPVGIRGLLCAVMLAAFISTHDTYLHSWGSIFIQDVVMPFRKTHFSPKKHIWLLRLSAIGVAIFIFFFSLWYDPTEAILMFFALTGSIFVGGAGAVIIGGLYWKKGTTNGAWAAMITGASIAFTAFILRMIWPKMVGGDFPINSQWIFAITMLCSSGVYVVFSLLEKKMFNMDKMLHRGKYAADISAEEQKKSDDFDKKHSTLVRTIARKMGLSKEFSRIDKVIFYATVSWSISWFAIFLIGNLLHLFGLLSDGFWLNFWGMRIVIVFALSFVCTIWIALGGLKDIRFMLKKLRTAVRDEKDDGTVQ